MAFSDPLIVANVPVFAAPSGGTTINWRRVSDGVYTADGLGSFDEPYRIVVKNAAPVSTNQETRFEVQLWRYKNVAVPTGVSATSAYADDALVMSFVTRFVPRSFTATDLYQQLCTLAGFLGVGISNVTLSRLMLGEK